jgi:hypothetical protein
MRPSLHCGKCGALKIVIGNGTRRCMDCHRRRERGYYEASHHRRTSLRRTHLRRRYGVSLEYVEKLLLEQGMQCAICGKHWRACVPAKRVRHEETFLHYLCVDHDHDRGRVRGLLCNACNTAIGLFEEEVGRLAIAIDYIRRHAQKALPESDVTCRSRRLGGPPAGLSDTPTRS